MPRLVTTRQVGRGTSRPPPQGPILRDTFTVNSWPHVTFGGMHEPYVDRVMDEMPYFTHPKKVAAYGTVEGYPWSLVLFKKNGDPEDDEPMAPDHQPNPARSEFFLDGSEGLPGLQPGGFGGGGGEISLRPEGHIDTSAHI